MEGGREGWVYVCTYVQLPQHRLLNSIEFCVSISKHYLHC